MIEVGVRELKNQATEILREVREQQAEYIVTYRGKPIAVLLPFNEMDDYDLSTRQARTSKPIKDRWADMDGLRQEIARQWKTNLTAVEAVNEQRR
jgi:prevent-host-death family protein